MNVYHIVRFQFASKASKFDRVNGQALIEAWSNTLKVAMDDPDCVAVELWETSENEPPWDDAPHLAAHFPKG